MRKHLKPLEAEFILIHSDFLPREIRTLVLGFNTTEACLENRKTGFRLTQKIGMPSVPCLCLPALSHISGRPRPWNWKHHLEATMLRLKKESRTSLIWRTKIGSFLWPQSGVIRKANLQLNLPVHLMLKSFRLNSCYSKRQKNQLKMGKDRNKQFSKEGKPWPSKHMRRYLTSLSLGRYRSKPQWDTTSVSWR